MLVLFSRCAFILTFLVVVSKSEKLKIDEGISKLTAVEK